jgi:hypothetical protein
MQIWNNLRGDVHVLSTLFADKRYPRRPSRTRRISKLVSPPNGGNRYGVRLTAYYKVRPIIVKCELRFNTLVKMHKLYRGRLYKKVIKVNYS